MQRLAIRSLRKKVDLVHGVTITLVANFGISAEYGHSNWNGGILPKKQKNSAKIGMVGSYGNVYLKHLAMLK